MSKLEVNFVPLFELKKYEGNAKIHTDRQIEKIKKSIEEFGFNDPIAIDENSNEIISGHGRYEAAKRLKLEKVPVIKIGHLSEPQRRAYRIAHNKITSDTGFDESLLQIEFDLLSEANFDLELTGFDNFNDKIELPDLPTNPTTTNNPSNTIQDGILEEEVIILPEYHKTHVLLSFHPDIFPTIKESLDIIAAIEGVEYDQSSN